MQTIGERFEEARKKKGISIREAAEATKIRGDYLQKFESNHFDIGLTEIYTRGFLRNYANFLKVPADRLLNDYSALGRGEARPRQPSREVYGRMDISVATAGEGSDRAAPPGDEPAAPPAARTQPHFPRGSSSLPSGPDPAVIFKYVKWAGAAAVVIVLLVLAKSFFSGGSAASSAAQRAAPPPVVQTAPEPTITLIALDTVRVKVATATANPADSVELFQGTLVAGQSQVVKKPGAVFITATAGENLMVEIAGKRYPMPFKGYERAQIQ
jgi:transcriptional regulator with XRE-family HTH domain